MDNNSTEQLLNWNNLLKEGLINEDEFRKKKEEILNYDTANVNLTKETDRFSPKQTQFQTTPKLAGKIIYSDGIISIREDGIIYNGITFKKDEIEETQIIKHKSVVFFISCGVLLFGLILFAIGYYAENLLLYIGGSVASMGVTGLLYLSKPNFRLLIKARGLDLDPIKSGDSTHLQQIANCINDILLNIALPTKSQSDSEMLYYNSNNVLVSDDCFSFSGKTLSIDIIEKTKIEFYPTDKKTLKIAATFCIIMIITGHLIRNLSEIAFLGYVFFVLILYCLIRNKYSLRLFLNDGTFKNSLISKNIEFLNTIDESLQEALRVKQSKIKE